MIYSIVRKLGGIALVSVASLTVHDLSLRKTPEVSELPIPPECGETFNISTDWLSQALGFSLNSHSQKSIGGGFTTTSVRLNLNPTDPSKPRSAVVKYYSEADANNWQKRFFMLLIGGIEKFAKKEIFFYRHLHGRLEELGIKSPKPFYLEIQDYGGRSPLLYLMGFSTWFRSVMILEDLGQHKSWRIGKHIPDECAEIAAKNLAILHSSFWDNNTQLKLINPDLDWTASAYETFFEKSVVPYPKKKEIVTERLNNWQEIHPIFNDPELRSSLISLTNLYSQITDHQKTHGSFFSHSALLHGDFHPGNMFFVTDPETKKVNDAIFIDWQCYGFGNPSTEFAYFLSSNIKPDPARDQRLMKIYYDELTQKVSPASYPWEVFVREVELRSMVLVAGSMNMIKQTPQQSEEMAKILKKEGIDYKELWETQTVSNFQRANYILQKWQKEKFIEELENTNLKEEKVFLGYKIPEFKFNLINLLI